jgi:PKD repeat protein
MSDLSKSWGLIMKFSKLNIVVTIIILELSLMCIVGCASGYQLFLSCPGSVQVGIPLKCSIDSNFPAGTTFDVVMYPPGCSTTPLHNQTVTIQEDHATQYQIFDTTGLPGGQYRVEIQFIDTDEDRLSSDSIILQQPRLLESLIANFSCLPRTGVAPLTVQFSDNSTGSPNGWAWYFGDENYTESWTQMTASAGWSGRRLHSSVVMPDGSIVLMGGSPGGNDVWRSMDNGATWTLMTANAEWSARIHHSSVVMPDGSIVLMGGTMGGPGFNDVWRSTDAGATWTQMTASAGWEGRYGHTSVAIPDGSIVLMGGAVGMYYRNDVWRSTDYGATWTLMNASAGWSARMGHSSVALADCSIVLMGGSIDTGHKNDVWRSTDYGATWTQMTASAGWSERIYHSSVAMPDGSIVLLGGDSMGIGLMNDVWRSTDNGVTWTQMTASAEWSARSGHTSMVMPDGSIVLIGGIDLYGNGLKNDAWRFMPAGSTFQNPSHTYTIPGMYRVSLQAYNADGYNSTRKVGYIDVDVNSGIAIFRPSTGYWYFDNNLDSVINFSFRYGGSTDQIIKGDWQGTGRDGIAIFRNTTGYWYFDNNLDGTVDKSFRYGGGTDRIIAGKWSGTSDGIAIFRPSTGYWYFDYNLDGIVDKSFRYGGGTDRIIAGKWSGTSDGIAIFRPSTGYWYFDYNLDGIVDKSFRYGGSSDQINVGDWDGDGLDGIAIFRPSTGYWYFDYNLDGIVDKSFRYGGSADRIISDNWSGTGDGIAIFRPSTGYWYFDYNLDGIVDKSLRYGGSSDQIITGNFQADITSISPTFSYGGTVEMTIIGSGIQPGFAATLTQKVAPNFGIVQNARDVRWDSTSKGTAWFTLYPGSKGFWSVVITNPDGSVRSLPNGFEVR